MLTARDGSRGGELVLMGQARLPEGDFEIRNVPAGQYVAHAQSGGPGSQQFAAAVPLDVVGSHVSGLVLRLSSGGDVEGSVKVADGTPATEFKNLQVSLRPSGFGGQAPRAKVGEDLKFTLKGVPPLKYIVYASGLPENCYVKSIRYGGADVPDDGVEMSSGGVLEVVLSAGASQIDVVVTAGENKAAAGAQVLLLKDGIPDSVRTADENGMLSIKGLKPASYRVLAWEDADPDQLWDPEYLRRFENEGKALKLDNGAHEALQLKAIVP
jgi:hypothetical protein